MKRGPIILAALGAAALAAVSLVLVRRAPRPEDPVERAKRLALHSVTLTDGGCWHRLEGPVMSTTLSAKALFARGDRPAHRAAMERALVEAALVERRMSRFWPESEVFRLSAAGAGKSIALHESTFEVLRLSREISRRSGGAFDVTVGPLVRLYRRAAREGLRLPTDAEIAGARKRVGFEKLLLDAEEKTAALKAAGMTVDLSAVAKGCAVDRALAALRAGASSAALVEIGGEVRAFGAKPGGKPWRVGLRHPRAPGLMAELELSGGALATSGDYEQFLKKGGRRASHILDPRTGKPLVGGAVSVSVLAPSCALADGLATAVSVLGPAEGLKLLESYRAEGLAVEAVIIEETADGGLVPHISPGLAGKLKLEL